MDQRRIQTFLDWLATEKNKQKSSIEKIDSDYWWSKPYYEDQIRSKAIIRFITLAENYLRDLLQGE